MISFKSLKSFKCDVRASTSEEYEYIKTFLTTNITDKEYEYKTKRWLFKSKDVLFSIYSNENERMFLVPLTLGKILNKYILESEKYDTTTDFIIPDTIPLLEKWQNIFKSNPKIDNGKIQIRTATKLLSQSSGIASLFTGIGKTEILLSVAESFLFAKDVGNVLIITYSNKVLDEISLRAKKYGIEIGGRVRLINPVGYYRSNLSSEDHAKEWLSNVDLVIADEAHHFSSLTGTWAKIVYDSDPTHIYGFTATGDIADGGDLEYTTLAGKSPSLQVFSLMSFCGESAVNEDLPVPIRTITVKTQVTDKAEYEKFKEENPFKLQFLISQFLSNKKTPALLSYLIRKYVKPESICFIPELTSIETGVYLSTELNALGIPTVYYSGSSIITPVGEVNNLTLEDLKSLASQRAFKVLISNSVGVEGIDVPNLSSIIPLTGASYKSTIQPLGRSARADEVTCIFIFDRFNHQMNKQMKYKQETMRDRLNIISNEVVIVDSNNLPHIT